jgi:hypothetical protein
LETIESGEGRIGYGDDYGVTKNSKWIGYGDDYGSAGLFFIFFSSASIQIDFCVKKKGKSLGFVVYDFCAFWF